jgi:hypothetical protein
VFGLLRDTSHLSDNLTGRKYESYVLNHSTEWLQSALSLVAANSIPPAAQNTASPAAGKTVPNGLYFPSSASIPPVSIMNAEPTGSQQQGAASADANAKAPTPVARKPAPSTQQARRPANPAPPGRPAPAAQAPEQAGDQ